MPTSRAALSPVSRSGCARKPSIATRHLERGRSSRRVKREAAGRVGRGRASDVVVPSTRRTVAPRHGAAVGIDDPAGDRAGRRPSAAAKQESDENEEAETDGRTCARAPFGVSRADVERTARRPGILACGSSRRSHAFPRRAGRAVAAGGSRLARKADDSPLTVAAPRGIRTHFAWPPGEPRSYAAPVSWSAV